jgi:DNA (cytosine-5)-methyltransferase 1
VGSRNVALKSVTTNGLFVRHRYVPSPTSYTDLPDPVTVKEAIGDLPPIVGHLDGTIKRGARRFDKAIKYHTNGRLSGFARQMRSWPGFEGGRFLWDHVIRSLSMRDYRLFKRMPHGCDYPNAVRIAEDLFQERLRTLGGDAPTEGSQEYNDLTLEYIPPYDPSKFPNRWRKIEPDKPSRTLMAHLGKDSYTHIHPDSKQARTISVREAARLQSFPDGFRFSGTMNTAFRQIGNAVPAVLAWALAVQLLETLGVKATVHSDNRPDIYGQSNLTSNPVNSGGKARQ